MTQKKRLVGITISSIIFLTLGVFHIGGSILTWKYLIVEKPFYLFVRLILPGLYIVTAIGLLRVKYWALETAKIICIFQISINVLSVFGYLTQIGHFRPRGIGDLIDMLIYLSVFLILYNRRTKLEFTNN